MQDCSNTLTRLIKIFQHLKRAEILNMGQAAGIFDDKDAQSYLCDVQLKPRGRFDHCNKAELAVIFHRFGVTDIFKDA